MNRSIFTALLLIPCLASADALDDGKALLKQRDYKAAIVQLDAAAKTDASGEATYCLAMAYDLSGDQTKAIEAYKKVVDSKGKRAGDAERSMKSLEAGIAATTAVERARVDFQRPGLENSTRLKEAHDRVDKATITQAQRELAANKVAKDLEKAITAADEAERNRRLAERKLSNWKTAGLVAPEDHGRGRRVLGTVLFMAGGAGVGVAFWYARTATTSNDAIHDFAISRSNQWTDDLEWYSNWGPRADARLPYAIVLGSTGLVLGSIVLGLGEGATQEPGDSSKITSTVERAP